MKPLDLADRRILQAVQRNCSLSAEELGEQCVMSPSTALRRLKRLRDTGVITSEVAILDPRKVGRPLLMIVGVRLERDDASVVGNFLDRIRADPAVMQCYFVTGSADYILHISARDMDEFNELMQDLLVSNPHVSMSETSVVMKSIKVGLTLPILD